MSTNRKFNTPSGSFIRCTCCSNLLDTVVFFQLSKLAMYKKYKKDNPNCGDPSVLHLNTDDGVDLSQLFNDLNIGNRHICCRTKMNTRNDYRKKLNFSNNIDY